MASRTRAIVSKSAKAVPYGVRSAFGMGVSEMPNPTIAAEAVIAVHEERRRE
jgi:hypothetical protein